MPPVKRLLALALVCAAPAHAIVIRPDRDDAEYLELATRYPSAIQLGEGEGVLVAPRWVLTSARTAKALQVKPARGVVVGSREHEIQAFRIHDADIALIVLRKAVTGFEPTPLYRLADEAGKGVAIVGHGGGKKRAAINTVDRVEPRLLGLRVKPLEEASDLQGAATASEAGAPAYVETKGGIFVAGVLARVEGDWSYYTRVSPFVPWIEAVMRSVAVEELDSLLDPDRR